MLRSMQTTDPLEAWAQVHPLLIANFRGERLAGVFIHEKLSMYCRGMRAVRDTLDWAIENGLLVVHREDIPSSYSLRERGRAWSPNP